MTKKTFLSFVVLLALVASYVPIFSNRAMAASVTTFSDSLSRLKASTAANHEIFFVAPTGLATGQNLTLTFSSDFTGVGSIVFGDLDLAEGSTGVCTSATYTEETLVASGASTSQFNAAGSGQVITFTSGGVSAIIAAGKCVRIRIGTNAVSGTTGVNQISNGAADDDDTIAVGGSFGDSGTATVDIISDDQVVITATVDPTLTFTIDDNAIGFGSLSSVSARYATTNAAGSGSDSTGNTLTVATNAASGYSLTYNGATLTSGLNTINASAGITGDADGTPGSEQFALSATVTGTGSPVSGYNHSGPDWKFIAGAATPFVAATAPVAGDSIAVHYLANISGATEAGSYATTLTYTAVGNF